MRPWVEALNGTVDTIKKLAENRKVAITDKDIAEKMGMTEAEFRACMSGEAKVPKKLMSELWPAYEYLLLEEVRAGRLDTLKDILATVQRQAEKYKVAITQEEIARRIDVTPETLQGWLNGSIEVPDGLHPLIFDAFRSDLFRNAESVRLTSTKRVRNWTLPPEDEL